LNNFAFVINVLNVQQKINNKIVCGIVEFGYAKIEIVFTIFLENVV